MAEGQQSKDTGGFNAAIILISIFAAIAFIWFKYSQEIITLLFHLRVYELKLFTYFNENAQQISTELLQKANDKNLSYFDFRALLIKASPFIMIFYAACVIPLCIKLWRSQQKTFKKFFSLVTLRQQEKKLWPQITPIVNLQLLKEDIDKGPWAMANNPTEFCKQHNLLIAPPKPEYGEKATQLTADLDLAKTKAIYEKSLGPKLTHIDTLPMHIKALFAVFAARAMEERDGPAKLLKTMSKSAYNIGKINFSGAQELFDKYKNADLIQSIVQQHAYIYTMMSSILALGRIDGVIAAAEFLWLKPYDRTLWYVLNNVGRQTSWTDTAGIYAHWKAEQALQHKLEEPVVDEAVNALKEAIAQVIYKDN